MEEAILTVFFCVYFLGCRTLGQGGDQGWKLQRQRWDGPTAQHAALQALRHRAAQAQQDQRQVGCSSSRSSFRNGWPCCFFHSIACVSLMPKRTCVNKHVFAV
jgi:hypothetical protein